MLYQENVEVNTPACPGLFSAGGWATKMVTKWADFIKFCWICRRASTPKAPPGHVTGIGVYVFKSSTGGPARDGTQDLPHHTKQELYLCATLACSSKYCWQYRMVYQKVHIGMDGRRLCSWCQRGLAVRHRWTSSINTVRVVFCYG